VLLSLILVHNSPCKWHISKAHKEITRVLNGIWTLARKMPSFRFPENDFVLKG